MLRLFSHFVIVAGIFAGCLCLGNVAQAQEPKLIVEPAGTLHITGVLDGQTDSFSADLRLTAAGGRMESVRLLASPLQHTTEPETRISRSAVSVPSSVSLESDQPFDVKVTVNDVKRAGVYTGALSLLAPGQSMTDAISVPLELTVNAKPNIKPVVADQAFQITRCDPLYDCWLAALLLSGSSTRDERHVLLDNQASQPANVRESTAVMLGGRTGAVVTAPDVVVGPVSTLPAEKVTSVPVTIQRSLLSADRYQGKLRFLVDGLDEPVTINTTIDVRNGPLGALIAVLLGIIVGRMARNMETPVAQKWVKLLPRYYELQADIDRLEDLETRKQLAKDLKTAKNSIDSRKDTEDVASALLDALAAKIAYLLELQQIEVDLKQLPESIQAQGAKLAKQARRYYLGNEIDKAQVEVGKLQRLMEDARSDSLMGMGDAIADVWRRITDALAAVTLVALKSSQAALEKASRFQASAKRRTLAFLSGLFLMNAETDYWFIRPILSIVLLIVLGLLGLQTLYVNAGATFGVNGLYDYLGLFLWGITADVAQRTLFNLPKN